MSFESNTKLDIDGVAEFLNLPSSKVKKLASKKRILQNWGKYQNLFRFDKKVSKIESGTVLYQNNGYFELIRGFPKIKRAMAVEPAVKSHFKNSGTVSVEEKMNGYNVRVASINGDVTAFTRSGIVCPYTTERAKYLIGQEFFEKHPEFVLYGEMVGPDNPYVPKNIYNIESLDFFIFDIRYKNTGEPLPVYERRKLMNDYNLNQVQLFGEYKIEEAPKNITKIIKEIGKQEREGVVIKDPQMRINAIKYTSSESNCADLREGFKFYNDFGRDYFYSRVIREGFQSVELGESEEEFQERCLQLGRSILEPMSRTMRKVAQGEEVHDDVQIRVKEPETIYEFEKHLKRMGIDAKFGAPQQVGDEYLVSIRKLNQSTNDKTKAIWNGSLWKS
ncbi:ATP dependent DNA ligase [Methanohalobium evestigatum Z-7303]|uniref:ATP dependent DNA ligase n=1 Tax=Methanohalobium evestigatum (strain ATCC BAA-1072 / DSM 3721 / NBRC 107634 / OCM 161 / Z-7303) TaxID=644295 RepID=D7E5S9_METEZ|nr:RNA ligase [Methanohalobium evestigatum]ADI72951.1 ATP dependent DNA ligase [Methanohalobium evestigatum Z-7303]